MKVLRFTDVVSNGLAAGKRVFIRADLNVPQDHSAAGGGRITEDTRIRASVPCIRMALDAGAAVMVTSHLGRPTEGEFKPGLGLPHRAARLCDRDRRDRVLSHLDVVPAADPGGRRADGDVDRGAHRRALQPVHHPRRGADLARRYVAGRSRQSGPFRSALRDPRGDSARGQPRGPGREIPEGEPVMSIELRNVSRWYGNVVAVNDVTMSIGPGVTGLLGPNGAGKSTLLHMMAGFLPPSRGELTINTRPSWRNAAIYRVIGLVPERDSVYSFLTGRQFVLATAKLHELPDPGAAAARAIDLLDMADAAGRKIATYSKGMRQRIKVAGALVHDPEVLLLDEPFNGMDPRQRLHMMDLLDKLGSEGRTILFSSHILEEVERLSGTIQVVVAGRLAASGDFRAIRRLMTSRPHVFTVRSSDDRLLGGTLIGRPAVTAVELTSHGLQVRTSDYGAFCRDIAVLARERDIRLREVLPTDESLESVFAYLVSNEASS